MPYKSRWAIDIPNTHLASLLLTSPTAPLSDTHRCFLDAANPETRYFTPHGFRLWCQRVAMGMRKSGLKQGDRVLLFSGNDLFFPVVFMGIIMSGGIFTGANPRFVARELAYQLQDSGAKYLLCAPSSIDTAIEAAHMAGLSTDQVFVFENLLEQHDGVLQKGCRHWSELVATAEEAHGFAWEELSTPQLADTTLALNYSSGTTGRPKGVEITHKNYVANVLQATHNLSLGEGNLEKRALARWLCFLPMYHAMAQTIFIASALYRNTPVYVMPKFDLTQMLEYTEKYRITDLFLVPPVAVALAKNKNNVVKRFNLSSVEVVTSGAAPLGREICAEVESIWPPGKINVKQGWGMTEATCTVVKWDPREISTSTSVGEPIANCEVKIMAEDGVTEIVERNQRGEMWVRAPNVMKGYWRNPGATRETKTEDGWLKTGDIAYVDNHSKFYVVDRIKELIKVKGNQVAPAELEALLLTHPAIADAAVIGITMNNDECPRAYVVLKPGQSTTVDDVLRFMIDKVSPTKRITGGVIFVDEIPKNPSGKILRKVLREQALAELKQAKAARL